MGSSEPHAEIISSEPPGPPLCLSTWDFAGLMTTYWCNAKCAFCYVYSGPDRGGRMAVQQAVDLWRGLDRLAARDGRQMRVHFAGGEPFGEWDHLVSMIKAARNAGLTPLEKVETNAFWAGDDDETRARLALLDSLGMEMLVVSADVYHQEFVPVERVRRCVEIAREVLGAKRVRVRWWDFYHDPVDTRHVSTLEKHAAYRSALERHSDRLTGRAADRLSGYFERFPARHFASQNCVDEVLSGRHVHIDPYGNVFPGVCAGIVLGQVRDESAVGSDKVASASVACRTERRGWRFTAPTIDSLWDDLSAHWREHPVVSAVAGGGSHALFEVAKQVGYRELPGGYANKCHLCTHVRQFLFEAGDWHAWVGPAECYASAQDRDEARTSEPLVHLSTNGRPLPVQPPRKRTVMAEGTAAPARSQRRTSTEHANLD